jgi:hypothetical protein
MAKKFREIFEFMALGETEGIRRVRVRIRNIVSLGFINRKVYTKTGTFKEFDKVGFIDIKHENTRYITSKYIVRDFINMYKQYIEIVSKEEVSDLRCNKPVKGYDWTYKFVDLPEPVKKTEKKSRKERNIDK